MSERDRREYQALKSDPERYAAYLERKRIERSRRNGYETERKRRWRSANREKDQLMHAANYAVESAVSSGKIVRPDRCERCEIVCVPEAHHYKGYAPENRVAIHWLCQMCHSAAHYARA